MLTNFEIQLPNTSYHAYIVGTHREDVLKLLSPIIISAKSTEIVGLASVACGMVSIGRWDNEVVTVISNKIIEYNFTDALKSPYMHLTGSFDFMDNESRVNACFIS